MSVLSPELALVDPALAEAARAQMPAPSDVRPARIRRIGTPDERRTPATSQLTRRAPRPRSLVRRAGAPLVALIVAGALLGAAPTPLDGPEPRRSERPSDARSAAAHRPLLGDVAGASERGARSAARPVAIAWRPVRDAALYNVVLLRNGRRLDFWPVESRLALYHPEERDARPLAPPGRYEWYVYPGFRGNGRIRYGDLVANGSVQIPPRRGR